MENGMGSGMPEQPQEMPKTVSYGRRGADPRVIVGVSVAVLLILAFLFFFSWTRIRFVQVDGLNSIAPETVLRLAGLDRGATYFGVRENRIRTGIESNRYLAYEGMERIWPDTLYIKVYERERVADFLFMGVQYTLAEDAMVLESTTNIAAAGSGMRVSGLSIRDIRVGAQVICQDEAQLTALLDILLELKMQGVRDSVEEINLTNMDSIYLLSKDGFTANIGTAEDLRAKIGTVRAVTAELKRRGLSGGTIDATMPGQAAYRPGQ